MFAYHMAKTIFINDEGLMEAFGLTGPPRMFEIILHHLDGYNRFESSKVLREMICEKMNITRDGYYYNLKVLKQKKILIQDGPGMFKVNEVLLNMKIIEKSELKRRK